MVKAKDSGLNPIEWARLSRIDKKILGYARIMEAYRDQFSPSAIKLRKQQKKAELESMKPQMPRTLPRGR